jgi:hypothetical protein
MVAKSESIFPHILNNEIFHGNLYRPRRRMQV